MKELEADQKRFNMMVENGWAVLLGSGSDVFVVGPQGERITQDCKTPREAIDRAITHLLNER